MYYIYFILLFVESESRVLQLALRCMFFADGIVLLRESKEDLNERLET